jgi:hypothetical protein
MAQIYFHAYRKRTNRSSWIALGTALSLLLMAVVTVLVSEAIYEPTNPDGRLASRLVVSR